MGLYELFSVDVVAHENQRYATTGDWLLFGHTTKVSVSCMHNRAFEAAVGIHELIEAELCRSAGIAELEVCRFDRLYEAARPDNPNRDEAEHACKTLHAEFKCGCTITTTSEPGDDIHAPYYKQHQFATSVERMFLAEVGESWNAYEAANLALYEQGLHNE